jgi:hypothetical protein
MQVLGTSEMTHSTVAPARWVLGSILVASLLTLAGCANGDGNTGENTDWSEGQIYGGALDNDRRATTGVVALRVGTGTVFELCTGSLVAPNVVLTARHCISQNITTSVKCDEHGNSGNGDHVAGDIATNKIGVYVGSEPNFSKPGATTVKEIIHNDSKVLCNHDIALLVLQAPLLDVPIMPIRLGRQPQKGEAIRTVGYGRNDQKLPTGTRIRRTEVPVLAVGKGLSASKTPLGPLEFEVGQATCQGDSGGPAISEGSNAVIGVVSRGGDCTDNYGHIYTMTAGHEDLFDRAFASAAAGAPEVEPMDAPIKYVEGAVVDPTGDPATGGAEKPKSCSISAAGQRSSSRDALPLLGISAAVALVIRRRKRSQ